MILYWTTLQEENAYIASLLREMPRTESMVLYTVRQRSCHRMYDENGNEMPLDTWDPLNEFAARISKQGGTFFTVGDAIKTFSTRKGAEDHMRDAIPDDKGDSRPHPYSERHEEVRGGIKYRAITNWNNVIVDTKQTRGVD
jgi:hypothetical protein